MIELPLQDPVIQFSLLVATALAMQLAAKRIHLPGLLGLLVLGMLLGPGGLGILPSEPVVSMFGEIGLIYVMFLAGLEIDLAVVRRHRRETILFGVLAFACSAVPAVAAARLVLDFQWSAAFLLGALISSHTLIAYPLLLRMGLHLEVPVVVAVGGTLLTDTLALLLLAVVLSLTLADGTWLGAMRPLVLLAALTAGALTLIPRLSRAFFRRESLTHAERAMFALAVLLLLAIGAKLIGTEEILGAFLAGICLNRTLSERKELREHVEFAGRMLFIPFFFIWTGTLLELSVLTGDARVWIIAGLLLILVVAGKLSAASITGAIYGYTWRERLLMAGLTMPQAAATLAITVTAFQEGLFEAELVDAVVIVILLTCVIGPVSTQQIGRRMERGARQADDRPMHPPAIEKE